MRRLFLYILVLGMAVRVDAQTTTLLERHKSTFSPSEKRYNSLSTSMKVRKLTQLYFNPAFYEVAHHNDSLSTSRYRSAISTGYAQGEVKGDFLPYEGSSFQDYRLEGVGAYSLGSGTIFGKVGYTHGKHGGVGWNAMRNPELYLPYIATDSIGGDYLYDNYQVQGGYAFRLSDWYLGIRGSFRGEQAHRQTDPRALNNTTWLDLELGVARSVNGHLLMLQGGLGRNKQNVSLRYWRPGEQDRFFVCYGFGLYDIRKSGVSFGYSRMYYVRQGNIHLSYHSPQEKAVTFYADLGYGHQFMRAEESDIRDLYNSKTHTVLPSIKLDWKVSPALELSLWAHSSLEMRKGFENIFEYYLADEHNNIYDFRLIDIRQDYVFKQSESLGELRLQYNINPRHTIGIEGGVQLYTRNEQYKSANYEISNTSLVPHGKIDYLYSSRRNEVQLSVLYGKQLNLEHSYYVPMNNEEVQHLDFQHAFAPYAYFANEHTTWSLSATYIHHFRKIGLGLNGRMMYTTGERLDDVVYTNKIGYPSSAPMITVAPDRHDEVWGSASLFIVF